MAEKSPQKIKIEQQIFNKRSKEYYLLKTIFEKKYNNNNNNNNNNTFPDIFYFGFLKGKLLKLDPTIPTKHQLLITKTNIKNQIKISLSNDPNKDTLREILKIINYLHPLIKEAPKKPSNKKTSR
ncbi:MAG: hypothetical protein KAI16_01515 [Candidatus Pacebacteria bacterium]|nr:hypothetical protein [Candidatus Paceibacterota bacterium]